MRLATQFHPSHYDLPPSAMLPGKAWPTQCLEADSNPLRGCPSMARGRHRLRQQHLIAERCADERALSVYCRSEYAAELPCKSSLVPSPQYCKAISALIVSWERDLALDCRWQLTRLESVQDFQCAEVSLPAYSHTYAARFGGWGWLLHSPHPAHAPTSTVRRPGRANFFFGRTFDLVSGAQF